MLHGRVTRCKHKAFDLRLSNQDSVEWISVMRGKIGRHLALLGRNGQFSEPDSARLCQGRTAKVQLAFASL
jgi:hypothetical protein